MATKITTALVAALVIGALMIPNHEALARGGGGFGGGGFHGGGFGGGGFGFHSGFGRGFGWARLRIWTPLRILWWLSLLLWRVWVRLQSVLLRLVRMLLSSTACCSIGWRSRCILAVLRTGHLAGKPGMARLMAARNSQVTGNKTGAPASLVCSKGRKHHDR